MMNYQYPQTYILDNPQQLIKMAPTPPPILPVLDPSEVEQTLYQRHNHTDSLQALQINYDTEYYPRAHNASAPARGGGDKSRLAQNGSILFSKAPGNYKASVAANKPPACATPPPPPQAVGSISASSKNKMNAGVDIVSITPQSHTNMNSNSASNHSTASNNTTATTHIESASNHSSHHSHRSSHHSHVSHHSQHSPHAQLQPGAMMPIKQIVNSGKLQASAVPAPQLANPLPKALNEGIVIPMDQQNYNALLQQMYPQHPTFFNPSVDQGNRYNAAPQASNPYSRTNYTSPPIQDIYSTYDTNPYLYNTPPLPQNNGYYAPNPNRNSSNSYYSQAGPNYIAPAPKPEYNTPQYPYAPANPTYNYYPARTSPQLHALTHQSQTQIPAPQAPPQPIPQLAKIPLVSHEPPAPLSCSPTHDSITYLQRCDGTIISPNADPLSLNSMFRKTFKDDEADAFTAGDDALFGNNMVTIINVNWNTNIPFATIRMHISNRIHHVPLMDLNHIKNGAKQNKNVNRYRMGASSMNAKVLNGNSGASAHVSAGAGDEPTTVIRRNPKLSDETLMKLPHLRKHRDYIRTIDVSMGPKDYNSYRVSVNSKNNNSGDENDGGNNGRTANIQNLNAKNTGNLNANLNAGNKRKNKRMSACEKGDLFKTELCENWVKKGHCTYGKKCHFAHGRDDIRTRWRIENYKTQPCCDPARADSRLCLFGKRCNYAHPGEPLRRSHHCLYLDEEYQAEILKDYGPTTPYPFGIYI